ncbi:DUF3905 domain-containing protein [Longirhabdus pacifica]|uniref:DUF3905 domain-containing protein n=1 Tax=Longirhabdus pacifica TaxID=2305227 RepID=UPI001008BBDD|nr:DUF3905 domain-containing protein [Longirhabdus pacifica]
MKESNDQIQNNVDRNVDSEEKLKNLGDPKLDPYEIQFMPKLHMQAVAPFMNQHGVVIGDHEYESPNSPLTNWDEHTDPATMAGEEWVHPTKDIGFHLPSNKQYFEKGTYPEGNNISHPLHDVSYFIHKEKRQKDDG